MEDGYVPFASCGDAYPHNVRLQIDLSPSFDDQQDLSACSYELRNGFLKDRTMDKPPITRAGEPARVTLPKP